MFTFITKKHKTKPNYYYQFYFLQLFFACRQYHVSVRDNTSGLIDNANKSFIRLTNQTLRRFKTGTIR